MNMYLSLGGSEEAIYGIMIRSLGMRNDGQITACRVICELMNTALLGLRIFLDILIVFEIGVSVLCIVEKLQSVADDSS